MLLLQGGGSSASADSWTLFRQMLQYGLAFRLSVYGIGFGVPSHSARTLDP